MAMSENLWRECSAWLTRCKILAPDHKANWKTSEIRVLALTLRDGVLLCNLLTFLDPESIDPRDIHKKPQMAQFLCCINIKLFLDACKNHFGLRESDLFEPTMLYDLTNFHRVLLTLAKLSQCRKVQQLHPNLMGFNVQLSQNERSHSDEAIYRDLHSTDDREKRSKKPTNNDSASSIEEDEDDDGDNDNNKNQDDKENIDNNKIKDNDINCCSSSSCNNIELNDSDNCINNDIIDDNTNGANNQLIINNDDENSDIIINDKSSSDTSVTTTTINGHHNHHRHHHHHHHQGSTINLLATTTTIITTTISSTTPTTTTITNTIQTNNKIIATKQLSDTIKNCCLENKLTFEQQNIIDNNNSLAVAAAQWGIMSHSDTSDYLNDIDFEEEKRIYEDLCYVTFSSNLPELTSSSASFEQRDYVIRELVDTESNYLDVLNALRDKFMQPMEKMLTKEEIKIIFPRISELSAIHTKFLEKLREAILPNTKLKLSQVFLEFREPFLIYGEYCSNVTNAIDTLCDICKCNSLFEQLVMQCEKEYNVGKLQLRDILSVPMQRILKYHLLLDKLVKETSPVHDDFRGLERAKEAMVDVAQYINEVKRDSEHLAIIQKVKDSIVDLQLPHGNDLPQYGHLKLDGEFQIKAHDDQKTKHRYAFIFEKLIILVKVLSTKTGETQYTYRDALNLSDYRVEFAHTRKTLGRDTRFKCQLLLAHKSKRTAYTLYLKSETERNKWCKALNEAIDNLDPPGCRSTNHKFDITTFEVPVICRHCSKFLKGRIHQGYRCRVCEIAVHKGCISSTGRCKQNPVSLPPPVCDRQLSEYNWFAGPMDRDTAAARLETSKIGTYLLRVRPQGALNPNETMYALSLKTDDHVIKHMKINQKQDGDTVIYCLSSRRHFRTIVELVSYYERNDLGENFAGLNQSLQWPFKEVIATAKYDFEPRGSNQLQLKEGCQVLVIGKDGDSKGWWRGKIGDTVGYFPKDYVQEHSFDEIRQNEHL
ncbi:protein vav isoform X2 [Condylostylus longicornis]|uniref:protein vav isoform X2 n=1 Tax=Condylostylus longicornis TaxID=2530218 RepID=UPI00244DB294|nr:protein vav isoform X2 [Condylostylus longicornis]